MIRKSLELVLCFALCSLSAPFALAQANTARVTGTVNDATGLAIPGATIRLENLNTNTIRTASSASDGRFAFDFLPIGPYRLTVLKSGFQTAGNDKLILSAGQTIDLPVLMPIAQVTQSVVVTSAAPLIDTSTSEQ